MASRKKKTPEQLEAEALRAEAEQVRAEEAQLLEQAIDQALKQYLNNRVIALGVMVRRQHKELEELRSGTDSSATD